MTRRQDKSTDRRPKPRSTPRRPKQPGPSRTSAARHPRAAARTARTSGRKPRRILVVDIGGTKIKILVTGESEPRKIRASRTMTPVQLVQAVQKLANGWKFDAVSIGYPGPVGNHGPRSEPGNLGSGWVGFDFAVAFDRPVRIINDAAMQALGSYDGGRMLFLGLGTGLGSALISGNVIVNLELGQIGYGDKQTLGDVLGRRGLKRLGKRVWRREIEQIVPNLMAAFLADYVVLGGGNARELKDCPPGTRLGHNLTAFRGGYRLWHLPDVQTLQVGGPVSTMGFDVADWRLA